jgi:hypothetical protein
MKKKRRSSGYLDVEKAIETTLTTWYPLDKDTDSLLGVCYLVAADAYPPCRTIDSTLINLSLESYM